MASFAKMAVLALAFIQGLFVPSSKTTQTALVSYVYDGDTIQISTGEKVRLIGIDTPEMGSQEECYAEEATQKTRQLLLDRTVRLEKDISETDKYGRLLRYVWKGDELVNETLAAQGFAKLDSVPPDFKYKSRLATAAANARLKLLGLWSNCPQK